VSPDKIQEERLKYLTDEKRIKALTVLFSDLRRSAAHAGLRQEILLKSYDNLTFDGSSIRGFTAQRESDLRLVSIGVRSTGGRRMWFWSGQGDGVRRGSLTKGRALTRPDIRSVLKTFAASLYKNHGYTLNAANESKDFFSRCGCGAQLPRNSQVRIREHGSATTTRCGRSAAVVLLTRLRKCSVRLGFRMKRTIRSCAVAI